jgi:hypothetical protein
MCWGRFTGGNEQGKKPVSLESSDIKLGEKRVFSCLFSGTSAENVTFTFAWAHVVVKSEWITIASCINQR